MPAALKEPLAHAALIPVWSREKNLERSQSQHSQLAAPAVEGWGRGGGTSKGILGFRNVALSQGGISIRAGGGFEPGDFIPGVWGEEFSGIKGKLGCAGIWGKARKFGI